MSTAQTHISRWSGNQIDDSVEQIQQNRTIDTIAREGVQSLTNRLNSMDATSISAVPQVTTFPDANANNGKIVQYVGSAVGYTQGYFYQSNGSAWKSINVQYVKEVKIDPSLNASSTNPVQNKTIKTELDSVKASVSALASNTSSMKGKKGGYASLDDNTKVTADEASSLVVKFETGNILNLTHAGKFIYINRADNGAATSTITVPENGTNNGNFPIGTEIEFCRWNAGEVRFQGANGVTLRSTLRSVTNTGNYISIAQRYGTAGLKKIGSNNWLLTGSLK